MEQIQTAYSTKGQQITPRDSRQHQGRRELDSNIREKRIDSTTGKQRLS